METGGDGEPQSSYQVISFSAADLPERYQNFIRSKWKRTLRYGNDYFKLCDSDAFFAAYEKYLNHLFKRPNCVFRLAVLTEDHDVALGFSLLEGATLHYVYVQQEQRNKGIANSLVPGKINTISHLTKAGIALWNSKLPDATFNPFF